MVSIWYFRTSLFYSIFNSLLSQGNLSELGKLLMQGSFSVWTEHKKGHAKVKDLARFKPMQRHLFLHEKALLFCKRREENGEGYEKAPSYSFKQSLSVSTSTVAMLRMLLHLSLILPSIYIDKMFYNLLCCLSSTDECCRHY